MKPNSPFTQNFSRQTTGLGLAAGGLAVLLAFPLICAERGAAPRAPAPRPVVVDRSSHGTVRHVDTHVVQRPVQVRPQPQRPTEVRHEAQRPTEVRREPQRPTEVRHEPVRPGEILRQPAYGRELQVHRDVEADFHRRHFWNDFVFGRRHASLPLGFLSLQIGGVPYFYSDGIYYQPADGGYQEAYPPVGASVPQPPDGAIEIDAGGVAYYYAGGAFYLSQPDGTYAIAPTPIGVVVPELPPGAVQVSVKGTLAYQYNGIYYEPVFENGVTQYETFMP
jgi:Family of unknown function (DUF6515)